VVRREVPDAPVYEAQERSLVPLVITRIVGSHCDKGWATEDLVCAETNVFASQGNRELGPSGGLARDVAAPVIARGTDGRARELTQPCYG
jgi:hypothetical protein